MYVGNFCCCCFTDISSLLLAHAAFLLYQVLYQRQLAEMGREGFGCLLGEGAEPRRRGLESLKLGVSLGRVQKGVYQLFW